LFGGFNGFNCRVDAGAGGISLTANDKHSNDKHADNNLTNQSDNNPTNQAAHLQD
jgi:hypothetical protein